MEKIAKQHWQVVNESRDIVNNSAIEVWNNAIRYFKWSDDNPVITKETIKVGKGAGNQVNNEQIRPYSIKALCLHCNFAEEWLADIRNMKDPNSDWYIVVSKIIYIIYVQNYEMGMLNNYNSIFASKALNIDKEDKPIKSISVNIISDGIPSLSNSENEILEKLELENAKAEIPKEQNP